MTQQLRLRLRRRASFARADFVEGPSNAQARAALDSWPRWPGSTLALIGPPGSGKSHLARSWAAAHSARVLDRNTLSVQEAEGRPVLVEDVDRGCEDEDLFHLINMAAREGGGLLVTARTAPVAWTARLPDLRSRLNALMVAQIHEPDDQVLEGVLRKFFKDRSIRPPNDVLAYLLRRIERSIPAALDIVTRLDEAADAEQRPVTRTLARQVLEDGADNLDLFED